MCFFFYHIFAKQFNFYYKTWKYKYNIGYPKCPTVDIQQKQEKASSKSNVTLVALNKLFCFPLAELRLKTANWIVKVKNLWTKWSLCSLILSQFPNNNGLSNLAV